MYLTQVNPIRRQWGYRDRAAALLVFALLIGTCVSLSNATKSNVFHTFTLRPNGLNFIAISCNMLFGLRKNVPIPNPSPQIQMHFPANNEVYLTLIENNGGRGNIRFWSYVSRRNYRMGIIAQNIRKIEPVWEFSDEGDIAAALQNFSWSRSTVFQVDNDHFTGQRLLWIESRVKTNCWVNECSLNGFKRLASNIGGFYRLARLNCSQSGINKYNSEGRALNIKTCVISGCLLIYIAV